MLLSWGDGLALKYYIINVEISGTRDEVGFVITRVEIAYIAYLEMGLPPPRRGLR
jgi:hypothetical protein